MHAVQFIASFVHVVVIGKAMDSAGSLNLVAVAYAVICIAASLVAVLANTDEERLDVQSMADTVAAVRRVEKRTREALDADTASKKRKPNYNYERAHACVQEDYLKENALFGNQFERIYRVTKDIFYRLLNVAQKEDMFFHKRVNPVTLKGIYPEVKILLALKVLAFGAPPIAFVDYFQMGETTACECVKRFCQAVSGNTDLRAKYLRKISKMDAI